MVDALVVDALVAAFVARASVRNSALHIRLLLQRVRVWTHLINCGCGFPVDYIDTRRSRPEAHTAPRPLFFRLTFGFWK